MIAGIYQDEKGEWWVNEVILKADPEGKIHECPSTRLATEKDKAFINWLMTDDNAVVH